MNVRYVMVGIAIIVGIGNPRRLTKMGEKSCENCGTFGQVICLLNREKLFAVENLCQYVCFYWSARPEADQDG